MDKNTLLKYGTAALIIIFAIEIVALLFTQDPYGGVEPIPSPSPTPVPEQFEGVNVSEAYIIGIGREVLAICNSTEDVTGKIEGIDGVQSASYDPNGGRLGIAAELDADVDQIIADAEIELTDNCNAIFFKRAFVRVGGRLNFTSLDGTKSKMVLGSNFQCLQQSSFAQCFAFVQPESRANDTVELTIFVRMLGEGITFVTAEEPYTPKPLELKSADAEAVIIDFAAAATAEIGIPWAQRNAYSQKEAIELLNGSANYTQLDYRKRSELLLKAEPSNKTIELIGNLSYVVDVIPLEEEGVIIQVNENFSNSTLLQAEMEKLGFEFSQIEAPESIIAVSFEYSEEDEAAIRAAFSKQKVAIRRMVFAELVDPAIPEEELGVKLPTTVFDVFAANASINSTLIITLNAIIQGGEAVFVSAEESKNS